MKNLLKPISIVAIIALIATATYSQCCLFLDEVEPSPPPSDSDPYSSSHGWYLSVDGTLRVLIVFAEINYDVGVDPNPNSTEGWPVHSLPIWANDLFDPNFPLDPLMGKLLATSRKLLMVIIMC